MKTIGWHSQLIRNVKASRNHVIFIEGQFGPESAKAIKAQDFHYSTVLDLAAYNRRRKNAPAVSAYKTLN